MQDSACVWMCVCLCGVCVCLCVRAHVWSIFTVSHKDQFNGYDLGLRLELEMG